MYEIRRLNDALCIDLQWHDQDYAQDFLLISDLHIDSPHANRKLIKALCDEAAEKKAGILINGDLFDAMQGKHDGRSARSELRDEQRRDDYINYLIDDAAEFFKPYVDRLVYLGLGNHETAILHHNDIHLMPLLADKLELTTGKRPHVGGYGGWIFFRTSRKYGNDTTTGNRRTYKMFAYHGSGGANTTTKQNRRAILYPDADIVWTGHTHKARDEPEQRYRVTDGGKEYIDSQYHIVSGTFKAEHRSDYTGWADLREHKPPFYGGWWLQFAPKRSKFLQIELRKAA